VNEAMTLNLESCLSSEWLPESTLTSPRSFRVANRYGVGRGMDGSQVPDKRVTTNERLGSD
jgi:hypothetical protein